VKKLLTILLIVPLCANVQAQKFQKDTATAHVNSYVINNGSQPVPGYVLNEALNFILQSITDSIFVRNDSILKLFNGTELSIAPSKKRNFADSLDFPDISSGSYHDTTVALTGALDSDPVSLGVANSAVLNGVAYYAWISSTGNATIRFYNFSGSNKNPPKAFFRLSAIKQ